MIDMLGYGGDIDLEVILKDLSETVKANEKNILSLPTSGETEDFEEHPPVVPAYYPSAASEFLIGEAKNLKERGDKFAMDNRWQEALECYSEGLEHQEHRALYFNRGLCNYNLERYVETVSDCTNAIRLDDKYEKAYFTRGRAREKIGDDYGACIDFQSALICSRCQSRACWEAFTQSKPRALDNFYERMGVKNGRLRYDLVPQEDDGSEALPGTPSRGKKRKVNTFRLKYILPESESRDITCQAIVGRTPRNFDQPCRLKVRKARDTSIRDGLLEIAVKSLLGLREGISEEEKA